MRQAGFAYAQARMQARYAARPGPLDWQLIETGRTFLQSFEAVQRTSLAPMVAPLGRDSTRDDVEDALRVAWAGQVEEAATWAPEAWRPAITWLTPLPHLRLIAETDVAMTLPGAHELRARHAAEQPISDAWTDGFRARLPGSGTALVAATAPLVARFVEGPAPRPGTTAALCATLLDLFRKQAQSPAAMIGWLGLVAMDIERLRGALLLAVLFPTADLPEAV